MYAYLIDPFARTVTEVEHSGDYKQIYTLTDCETFTAVVINTAGDSVFIDDEGLINGKEQAFFRFEGYPEPLAGKGLILGCNSNGETVVPYITLEEATAAVYFTMPARINGQIVWLDL